MGSSSLDGGITVSSGALPVLEDDGSITDASRESFVDRTLDILRLGPGSAYAAIGVAESSDTGDSGGSVNVVDAMGISISAAIGVALAELFEKDSIDEHMEAYPQWHAFMVDGMYVPMANGLNVQHGMPQGLFDPTKVIQEIIDWIMSLGFDINIDFYLPNIILNLPELMLELPALALDCDKLVDVLKLCVKDPNEIDDDLLSQENEDGETICDLGWPPFELPDFSFSLPSLSLPSLTIPGLSIDFDFMWTLGPLNLLPIGIPSWPFFIIEFIFAIPEWFLGVVIPEFIINFPTWLLDIMAFIEWLISAIIELILSIAEKFAEYVSFAAAIAVLIHDMVIFLVLASIFYVFGEGLIITTIAEILM